MTETSSHDVVRFDDPARARHAEGREVLSDAKNDIATLLGDRSRGRDLLIKHPHLIHDEYHRISAAHLAALVDEMHFSFAEVCETATFYAHFDIVKEGEPVPPPLTDRACDSVSRALFGGERLLALRGVALVAAATLVAEVGDITRFAQPTASHGESRTGSL